MVDLLAVPLCAWVRKDDENIILLWNVVLCPALPFYWPPTVCFSNFFSVETFFIDKIFKMIKLWGMDTEHMYESVHILLVDFLCWQTYKNPLIWHWNWCFFDVYHIPSRADIILVITAVLCSILAWHHTKQEFLATCSVICCFRKIAHTATTSTSDRGVLCQQTWG